MADKRPDRLDYLKRLLYDRRGGSRKLRRSGLPPIFEHGASDWRRVEPFKLDRPPSRLTTPLLRKILWWSVLFFVLAAGVAAFIFSRGGNLVSSGNISLEVNGPPAVAAGAELNLQVTITNHNQAALELTDLIVEYPPGTKAVSLAGQDGPALARERLPIGRIEPGATADQTIRAILFGEKGSVVTVNFTVEYRLAQSNAIFDKATSYQVEIASTPIAVLLTVPPEANNNQEIVLTAEVQSNAAEAIDNPTAIFTYPSGFRLVRANPPPSQGQNIWQLRSLAPGTKQKIEVRGTIEGQDEEQKPFRVAVGTSDPKAPEVLAAIYGSASETLTMKRPFISLTAAVNDDAADEHIADSREPLRVDIDWVNNLPTEVVNGQLQAVLAGRALDQSSLETGPGFYQSSSNTVTWSKQNEADLASIPPGGVGHVSFKFASLALASEAGAAIEQPNLSLTVKFTGQRVNEGGATEPIYSEISKKIKFNSVAQVVGRVLQRTGPFSNSGPLPPKVDQETTYTIVWSVVNSSNLLTGAKVSAALPPYVRFANAVSPAGETLTLEHDATGAGTVVWDLGSISAGLGSKMPAREVSFQLGLTPSLSQVGDTPALLLDSTLTALDTFTKQPLTVKLATPLDTHAVAEANFQTNEDRVVK